MSVCPMCERKWEGWDQASLDTRRYFQLRGIHLTSNEGRIVAALVKKQRPLSNESLYDVLWGDDVDGGPEFAENCLKVAISKIRKKIAGLPFSIETIWGKGYTASNIKSLDGFPPLHVMAYVVLIPLFLGFPVLALAERICNDAPMVPKILAEKYGEQRVSAAVTDAGKLLERYENPATGTWTMIVYPNGAQGCMFASGTGWYDKKVSKVSTDPEA